LKNKKDQVDQVCYFVGMSEAVTVTEAKTQLSRLIERTQAGEEIVIRRGRRPVAKLIRYQPAPSPRRLGALNGKIWIADDFDAPDEEIERLFGTRD
jgi:prevent-host-death family protein